MRNLLNSILFIIVISTITCCSDDDSASVPAYRTDILCALTNQDSLVTEIQLDNGKKYNVATQKINGKEANAKLRCYASFSINDDSINAKVYEIKRISCYAPAPADSFKIHPQDPINVTSIWKSGEYINLCLAPLTTGMNSIKYDFCIDSVIGNTLHTSLLFKHEGAIKAYKFTFYHSIPLEKKYYSSDFDSIFLHVNTYEGMKVWKFSH